MKRSIRLFSCSIVLLSSSLIFSCSTVHAATIGVDAVHGFDADAILATGSNHTGFRTVITDLGHTIVPLSSFTPVDLVGLDAMIVNTPYIGNFHTSFSNVEEDAIQQFASRRAVFLDDSSGVSDLGDHPLTFGDNDLLLRNILSFISADNGALFFGENGSGFLVNTLNDLVAPYGVAYAGSPVDGSGHTVTGFVPHAITAGVQQIGVDFHLPLTITGPAIDLTIGGGNDNVLAVFDKVPEPSAFLLLAIGISIAGFARLRRQGERIAS